MTSKLEETINRLNDALTELREEIREAHGARKDLIAVEKEIRDLLGSEVRDLVTAAIEDEVRRGLDDYQRTIKAAMDEAVARVDKQFAELARLYTEGDGSGPSLPELAARIRQKRPSCRQCGNTLNDCTAAAGGGLVPDAGDASVCAYCGCLSIYTGNGLEVRPPTLAELADAEADPGVNRALRALGRLR